ncbi:MAG TPA: serine/threonine-protein kinase [Terriglobales bacterium]|nr:serine/threonine-protein kinase [Terriglobales bacterium]
MVATRVGTHLDRYEIDAELGRGAMGVVYRARDPKLDRTVAIKTVSVAGLEPDAEQEYRRRFVVEAQAAGRLSHPGIVTIFDVREEAEPYLVMEYVEGQSLQQLVSRDHPTLPLSTTLRLIQEVAEALHYAHAQGVVHRDIKPANILVTPDGHPKIADFGIAKLNQSELTSPGQVLGSPAFMAPEQLSEERVDARSDLFSLGVILYYLLTGHRPFQGNSTTTVCFKLVNHEPLPVSAFESKFSPELDKIVSRAIAKDPAQRYQSGRAMASDIQGLRESSGFVHGNVDWTKPAVRVTRDSGRAVDDNNADQARRARVSRIFLVSGLLAVALGCAAFWDMRSAAPNRGDPVKTGSVVDQRQEGEAGSTKEQTAVKPPLSRLKVLANEGKASIPAGPADAMLQIEIEHHFTNAVASAWVDNSLVYTQSLRGSKQRRAFLFRKVAWHQFEAIRAPSGKHQVRVRIQSAADSYDQSKIITGFIRTASVLRIVCGDKGEGLQLTLQK